MHAVVDGFPRGARRSEQRKDGCGSRLLRGDDQTDLGTIQKFNNPFRLTWRYQSRQSEGTIKKENAMLWTIAVILLILWALGLVSSYTVGGFIHILLVIALVVVAFGFLQGRRV